MDNLARWTCEQRTRLVGQSEPCPSCGAPKWHACRVPQGGVDVPSCPNCRGAVKVPEGEGEPGFDAVVDALIGAFHFPEDHACRVAVVVLETLRGQ